MKQDQALVEKIAMDERFDLKGAFKVDDVNRYGSNMSGKAPEFASNKGKAN